MLAQDRMTFRPCGEKAELWLLDQSDGSLRQTFGEEMQKGPAMLYVEAYGERAPVADDIAEARAYAGTFVLEEVLYAGAQSQVRGCDAPAASYVVAARGSEPFWAVEVGDGGIVWRQPEEPKEIDTGRAADTGRGRRSALSRQRQRPRAGTAGRCADVSRPDVGRVLRLLGASRARQQGIQRLRARWKIVSRANARGLMR